MDLKNQLQRLQGELKGLLARLSITQKVLVGLVAVLVAMVFLIVVRPGGGGGSDQAIVRAADDSTDPKALTGLQLILEDNGVPARIDTNDSGIVVLTVPRRMQSRAKWVIGENTQGSGNALDWLFQEGSITDSPDLRDKRYLESRKRALRAALLESPKIGEARLHVQKQKVSPFAKSQNVNDTASVLVTLAGGIERLSKKEAATIRRLVSGAFNLRPENIQLSDNLLYHYPHVDGEGGLALSDEQDRVKNQVLLTLQQLYGAMFSPAEFVVGVLVDVSRERSRLSRTTYDPEAVASEATRKTTTKESGERGPGQPVGTAPNAQVNPASFQGSASISRENEIREITETETEVRFSSLNEERDIPAGELKGISVNLVLDRTAVLEKLDQDGLFTEAEPAEDAEKPAWRTRQKAAVDAFIQEHSDLVTKQMPASFQNVSAKVSVVSFPKPPELEDVAFAGSLSGWLADYWKDIGLAVIALIGLVAFLGLLRRSVPAPLEIPTLEDRILLEDENLYNQEVEALRQKIDEFDKTEETIEDDVVTNELEDNLDRITRTAQSRPESVAAVVRTWLSGAAASEDDGENPKPSAD